MSCKQQVLVTVPFSTSRMRRLREAAGDDATVTQALVAPNSSEMRELLSSADVVIGEPSPELLAQQTRIRWVQMTWAGSDLYTQGAITFPEGVRLTNVAGAAFGHIISQYVVGQMLALAQNLPTYVRQQTQEEWATAGPVLSLEGATVLIFGAGDIGTCTARRLSSFSCHCLGVCRNTQRSLPPFERLVTLGEAEELLGEADVVVGCLPNTPETAGYFNERRLRAIKPGGLLVNVGRGNFVDCDALARVLAEGHLRGAALDVTCPEPLPKGHPLWSEPRCAITPHQAGGSFGKCPQTEERICSICCENLRHWFAGEPLEHVVY